VNAAKLMFNEVTVRGIVEFYASDEEFWAAMELANQARIRPIIDRMWPLEKLAEAQRQMERGQFFGKIVVTP
jgi:NADPH:quinone reductase-like Zn-dependent oxidoreductase